MERKKKQKSFMSAQTREKISKAILKKQHASYAVYQPPRSFDEVIEHLQEYIEQFGNADVPTRYVCGDGFKLGQSIYSYKGKMRELEEGVSKRIKPEKYELLKSMGVSTARNDPYGPAIEKWQEFYEENGHFYVPKDYFCPGVDLYNKVKRIMKMRCEGRLSSDYSKTLDEMGVPKTWSEVRLQYEELLKKQQADKRFKERVATILNKHKDDVYLN